MSGDGSFVVAWYRQIGIHVQRFNATGTARGPVQLVVPHPRAPRSFFGPYIAMARDGRFVVVWYASRENILYARLYDAGGAPRGGAFAVNAPPSYPLGLSVAMAASTGSFTVAWSARDDSGLSAFARMYAADGTAITEPLRASGPGTTQDNSSAPEVAVDATGNAVVVWLNPATALRARLFTAGGAPVGSAFNVATETEIGRLFLPYSVAMGESGEFVVAYQRRLTINFMDTSTGVYARQYAANGTARGAEFLVSQGPGYRADIDAAMDASNRYVVTWMQRDNVYGQTVGRVHTRLYRSSGAPVTNDEGVVVEGIDYAGSGRVGIDDRSNFLILLRKQSGSTPPFLLGQGFAGVYDTRPGCLRFIATRVGTAAADTINGTSGADVINALGGNDRIDGGGGADVICGGSGADVIFGSSGADQISGGSGDDIMDGGDGSDTCDGDGQTNADTSVQCENVAHVP